MLLNSINHAFKDAFYNLEKLLSAKEPSAHETAQCERLHSLKEKNQEASMASGEFLYRARRGENFAQDRENLEIVKSYVRTKTLSGVEDLQAEEEEQTTEAAAHALTKSITDEIPVFGLKASLHAKVDHPSFDAWKNVHDLKIESSCEITADYLPGLNHEVSDRFGGVSKLWRELSAHTALRLIDHPLTPGDVLMELAHHADPEVRSQVADNANTPLEAIIMLVKDECVDVRLSLAECYHLNQSVLEMLLEDENPYVCDRAETTLQRSKAGASPSVIRALFSKPGAESAGEVTLMRARA